MPLALSARFQSSLEGNPEWNVQRDGQWGIAPISILTRGKPRVEPPSMKRAGFSGGMFQSSLEGNPEWNAGYLRGRGERPEVSILTRGKPRVEHR